jgi:hypothetical protein
MRDQLEFGFRRWFSWDGGSGLAVVTGWDRPALALFDDGWHEVNSAEVSRGAEISEAEARAACEESLELFGEPPVFGSPPGLIDATLLAALRRAYPPRRTASRRDPEAVWDEHLSAALDRLLAEQRDRPRAANDNAPAG